MKVSMSLVFGLKKFMSHIGKKSDRMTQKFLSTGEKNQGLAKEGEIKMSPFYVGGNRLTLQLSQRVKEGSHYELKIFDSKRTRP